MIVLTFDIDWAPDPVIDFVAKKLLERRMRATWFITHDSPAVRSLLEYPDLFEVGIHPFFHPSGTQGSDEHSIIENLLSIAPKARSVRMHGLLQSSNILKTLSSYRIENDVSLYIPDIQQWRPHRLHFDEGRSILRHIYVWEDDFEMFKPKPSFTPGEFLNHDRVAILDFHPIHIVLNSRNMHLYDRMKHDRWHLLDDFLVGKKSGEGVGTRNMFESCLDQMTYPGKTISDLAETFRVIK